MYSEALRESRRYEQIAAKKIKETDRPLFHLTPYTGWMNDPNGFCFYGGKYHMFYQYNPYASHWDTMHWGHAVSSDLLNWEFLPTALAPDEVYDQNGCFSGSAITLPDGRHLLMYTGVSVYHTPDGSKRDIQAQCIAVGDGVDYEKYEGNPVIASDKIPDGDSIYDFRDPKLWKGNDGKYYCAVGNRPKDGSGQILLYRSEDGYKWDYFSTLIKNNNRYGKMWECPDFFEIDGKWMLLTSPQDMLANEFEYHNGNGTLCVIGSFDEKTGKLIEECNQAIDYGIDFYAPQTVLTEDGRRIMIGWMQNWDACAIREPEALWAGQMSLPRELSLKDGKLIQKPVRELESLRGEKVSYDSVPVSDVIKLKGIEGRCADIEVNIRPEDADNVFHKFAVWFAENDSFRTSVSFRPHEKTVKIDRKFSGSRRAIVHQRRCLIPDSENGCIKLRIILDRYSAEIFINDGEKVMTSLIYTDIGADGISFFCDGEALIDVVKYELFR